MSIYIYMCVCVCVCVCVLSAGFSEKQNCASAVNSIPTKPLASCDAFMLAKLKNDLKSKIRTCGTNIKRNSTAQFHIQFVTDLQRCFDDWKIR